MAYDADTAIVLWPEYFDKTRTRAEGRKVPVELAVDKPELDIIAKGAMILDLEFEIDENAAYPGNWAAKSGCVRVEKGKLPKTKLLIEVAKVLVSNS